MAVTKLSDIINPQVMKDMIEAKIEAQLKITPYAKLDTTLVGVPGNTVTVPSWNYVGDAENYDVEGGAGIDTDNLSASSTTFTIKTAAKGLSINQTAINSGKGNPLAQAETQLAKSIAGKVDNDVLEAAYTATTIVAPSTLAQIAYNGIVDAVTKFEDEEDGIDKVMFIHPAQETTLLKDESFLSADKFTAGVAVNGAIGKIAGCWIKKSNKVKLASYQVGTSSDTKVTSSNQANFAKVTVDAEENFVVPEVDTYVKAISSPYFVNPIIKLEPDSPETEYTEDELPALTIFLKKDTQLDHEWLPKYQRHDFYATRYYGVAKTNDAKLVLAKFKK